MSFARLHHTIPLNLKLARLSGDAFRTWTFGLVYVQTHLTDGFIPSEVLSVLGVPSPTLDHAKELVENRCWIAAPNGYVIHDYLQWNHSSEERAEKTGFNRARQAKYKAKQKELAEKGKTASETASPIAPAEAPESAPPIASETVRNYAPNPAPISAPKVATELPAIRRGQTSAMGTTVLEYARLDQQNGFIGVRFRVPRKFHDELVGRYGGDVEEAEAALKAFYRRLDDGLAADESVPNIYKFIQGHFDVFVQERAAAVPATPAVRPVTDQRVGLSADFKAQLKAASARHAKE